MSSALTGLGICWPQHDFPELLPPAVSLISVGSVGCKSKAGKASWSLNWFPLSFLPPSNGLRSSCHHPHIPLTPSNHGLPLSLCFFRSLLGCPPATKPREFQSSLQGRLNVVGCYSSFRAHLWSFIFCNGEAQLICLLTTGNLDPPSR